ncbi:hypothetical protein AB1Y20_021647 [Prymnesium parvum]|uniref:A to I editase domain-containing protein n=1 Tax=Prymnesium parvum TaxID=97485 RepID=A0AB34JM60_PRYPA
MPAGEALRDAEKPRRPTCAFADRVARCAVSEFERLRHSAALEYRQTVLAAIVVQWRTAGGARLCVASIGCGTKFLRRAQIEADVAGACVRDCHAEVLARRAFRRYVAAEVRRWLAGGGEEKTPPPLFDAELSAEGRLQLAEGVTLHLYSSSQPCGNASIKRWAKPTAGPCDAQCDECEWPHPPHPPLHVPKHARLQGMVAASVKRECARDTEALEPAVDQGGAQAEPPTDSGVVIPEFASGTAAVGSGQGVVLSCSDKILRWNCLGLQGGLFAHLVQPLYLSTVVVGRRFSKPHCERALCCRAQALMPRAMERETVPSSYGIRHPAMLCTSVKLDTSVIDTSGEAGRHADFSDQRCLAWTLGDSDPELIDGSIGAVPPAMLPSRCSSVAALHLFVNICVSATTGCKLLDAVPEHVLAKARDLSKLEPGAPAPSFRELKEMMCDSNHARAKTAFTPKGSSASKAP